MKQSVVASTVKTSKCDVDTRHELVSIVLPTFNGEKYLSSALDSCLKQTHSKLEVLVVDDCSTDSTGEIIAEFTSRDSRVSSIRNPINRKLPGSLNVGFRHARGEYLTWTSDDNVFGVHAIATMLTELQRRSDIMMVYNDYERIDADGQPLGSTVVPSARSLAWSSSVGACFLYRAEVLKTIGEYDENRFCAEDYEYWLRIAKHFGFDGLLPIHYPNLYSYRIHEGALSSTKRNYVHEQTVALLAEYLPQLQGLTSSERSNAYFDLARRCYYINAKAKMVYYLIRSGMRSPLQFFKNLARRSASQSGRAGD